MRARRGLGLSAAAIAWLCFTPGAFATGVPDPNDNITYSAQTVALSAGGNTVAVPSGRLNYSTISPTTVKAGDTIVWTAPTGNTWTVNAGTVCQGIAAGAVAAAGNLLTCTVAGAATNFVAINNPTGAAVTLAGPSVQLLGQNIEVNQPSLFNVPSYVIAITVQNTAAAGGGTVPDVGPIAALGLTSGNTFSFVTSPQNLAIDLTGDGLPTIPPGAGFITTPSSGTAISAGPTPAAGLPAPVVSRAGFLGTFWINVNQSFFDARNGIQVGPNDPLFTNGSLNGAVIVTLSGTFATITSAYLIPNNNGAPSGNQSACVATPPANAIAGTINAGRNSIRFAGLTNPANSGGGANEPVFSVCLVTNGTQVIQASVNPQSNGVPAIAINTTIAVGALPAVGLTTPNQGFGSIDYLGTTFFVQNVFGFTQTGTRTYFRAVNVSNSPAQIWAVLTKDVPNAVPETGQGGCTFPAGGGTAPVTATCNTSFVANLTSPFVTTNLASAAGFLEPNTATYYTGDDIATLAGTTISGGGGFLQATVYLLSPNAGIRFSALSQGSTGVLVQTP